MDSASGSVQSEQLLTPTPTPTTTNKSCGTNRTNILIGCGILVLVLNCVLLTTVVVKLHHAQGAVDQAQRVFAQAEQLMDFPNRVLHGNLARVFANLVQTDYQALQRNVTKLAAAVQNSFESTQSDPNFLDVAKYASLVQSFAKKVGVLQPRFPPKPTPPDDEGVVNVVSYVTEWISTQADKSELRTLGQSCTALLDIALNIDWSGTYYWARGTRYASWNVNDWKDTGEQIYGYCDRVAQLDPSYFDEVPQPVDEVVTPSPSPAPVTPGPATTITPAVFRRPTPTS